MYIIFLLYNSDDLELEHFVARNSQRMSLRLQSKRRPAENMLPLSPAVKRSVLLSFCKMSVLNAFHSDVSNCKVKIARFYKFLFTLG